MNMTRLWWWLDFLRAFYYALKLVAGLTIAAVILYIVITKVSNGAR